MGFEDKLTSFEVARPVVKGVKTLMPLVRLVGRRIMDNLDEAIVLPGSFQVAADGEMPENVAGEPKFRVYSKVRLPIVQYVAENRPNMATPDFYRLASLIKTQHGIHQGQSAHQRQALELPERFRHIALRYDSPSADQATAKAAGFTIEPAKTKSGLELLLKLENPERFLEEAEVFHALVGSIRIMKPFVKKSKETVRPAIPIAWVSDELSLSERNKIINDIEQYAYPQYSLTLGAMLPPFIQ